MATQYCDDVGSLAFERYWASRGCQVHLFQYLLYLDGKECKNSFSLFKVHRIMVWERRCYACLYRHLPPYQDGGGNNNKTIVTPGVLKIQTRDMLGVPQDVYDGVQLTILADLFLHAKDFLPKQVVLRIPYTSDALIDSMGREAEHGYNFYAMQQYLKQYGALTKPFKQRVVGQNASYLRPSQLVDFLGQAGLDHDSANFFTQTFVHIDPVAYPLQHQHNVESVTTWKPWKERTYKIEIPRYCVIPPKMQREKAFAWVQHELKARCQSERLWLPCDRSREYKPFLKCPQQLMDALMSDYATTHGWCDFMSLSALIEPLSTPPLQAEQHFSTLRVSHNDLVKRKVRMPPIRIAFFLTVYTDAAYLVHLLKLIYHPFHYYMIHIDPKGSTKEFGEELQRLLAESPEFRQFGSKQNIFLCKEVHIVYGAATASILMVRAMSWFLKYATHWDYFVPLTGADYPLVPLQKMEKILSHVEPHMPFVMSWSRGTLNNIHHLRKRYPQYYSDDAEVSLSINATLKERGKNGMGGTSMEVRAYSFGPVLSCGGEHSFYRLESRNVNASQWLFPHEESATSPSVKPKANVEDAPYVGMHPSFDGVHRVWKKSDPATTGAYDRRTCEHIVHSEEGRKYYHFFKYMLLGSEEHYFVSLLYNLPRSNKFVKTLAAQGVFNTWELGLWEGAFGGFRTHTHFLTEKELPLLKGLSKRGVLFARKFDSKRTKSLLAKLDAYIHFNTSNSDAGKYWPGFFEFQKKNSQSTTSPAPAPALSLLPLVTGGGSEGGKETNAKMSVSGSKSSLPYTNVLGLFGTSTPAKTAAAAAAGETGGTGTREDSVLAEIVGKSEEEKRKKRAKKAIENDKRKTKRKNKRKENERAAVEAEATKETEEQSPDKE